MEPTFLGTPNFSTTGPWLLQSLPLTPGYWVTSALVVSKLSQLTPNYFFKKNNKLNIYKHKNVKQENYIVWKKK